jgi:hypothetical protein
MRGPRGISDACPRDGCRRGARRLVPGVRSDLPGARPPGDLGGVESRRLPPPHAGHGAPLRRRHQPSRGREGHGDSATDRAASPRSAGGLLPARACRPLRGESDETSHQIPQVLLERSGTRAARGRGAEAPRGSPGEPRSRGSRGLERRRASRPSILYWRTTEGEEVDFVVEDGERLLPIEVKSSRRPRASDAASLRTFLDQYGEQVPGGLLLHAGSEVGWLARRILSAPWWMAL